MNDDEQKYAGSMLHESSDVVTSTTSQTSKTSETCKRENPDDEGPVQKRPKMEIEAASEPSTSDAPPIPDTHIEFGTMTDTAETTAIEVQTENFTTPLDEEREKQQDKYRKIGYLIAELGAQDLFTSIAISTMHRNEVTVPIARRGLEIVEALYKNLTIIKNKLGDLAVGTVFENVDELTCSFAKVDPKTLDRIKSAESKIKQEIVDIVKTEPADDYGFE